MGIKICRFCLALGAKVFKLGSSEAKCFIENIFKQSGLIQDLHENHYICFECKALLDKSYNFIKRVLKAQEIFFHIMKEHKIITPLCIQQIDRQIIGLNLVTDIKYIDVFITENSDIKSEVESNPNLLEDYEFKTEIDDFDTTDPLDNPLNYNVDRKEVDIDFGVHFKGFTDTDSKIDINIPINCTPMAGQINQSQFNNFDDTVQLDVMETVLEHVKEEILDENDLIEVIKSKKQRNLNLKPKQTSKKTASKVQPSTSKNVKTRVVKKSNDSKTNKISKPKNKKRGRKPKYSGEYSEPYDGFVNSGQLVQQPDIPKYPAKCDHCSYEVPNRTAHFHHYLLEHKDKKYPYAKQTGKQFICQFCGLVNRSKSRHIDHELTHGTESNFTCSQCPKSFVNKRRLQKHTYRSHPLQMLECDYCGKKVKSRESLMIHIRAHTGERPFKCPFCGAGFAHRGNIRPHIRANHKKYLDQPDFAIKTDKRNTFYETTDMQILAPENAKLCASEMFMHLSTVMNNLQ